MKISVAMATYNGADFLVEQLDTIRKQTRPCDELIICDDRSTDNTVEIAEEYINKYGLNGAWKVYVNEQNLGYAGNFKKAGDLTTGDIVFFSDQDDTWREDKLQIMLDIMEAHPDCKVLATDYNPWYFGDTEKTAPEGLLAKMPDDGSLEKINLCSQSIYIGAIGCCMGIRGEFLKAVEPYWFDGWAQDDRMWKLAQCANGLYLLHSNLINHRIHANNTSTYGKYHTVARRSKLFKDMELADGRMAAMLTDNKAKECDIKLCREHEEMMRLRAELIKERKLANCFRLLKYLKHYQGKKSYAVDLYTALKGK